MTLERVPADLCSKTDETVQVFHQNFVTNSRFFVCIGVLALIYSDCAVSGFIALFFFISSIAWCAHLRALKIVTNGETISRFLTMLEPCKTDPDVCHYNGTTEMSALDIGVVAGFFSFAVWSINVWFLYKEYPYFSSPQDPYNSSLPETPAPTPILRIKPSLKGKNKKVHYVEI